MKSQEIRSLGEGELAAHQINVAEQLFRIRFAKSLGKRDGVGRIKGLRKDIARMRTISRERQLAQQKVGK